MDVLPYGVGTSAHWEHEAMENTPVYLLMAISSFPAHQIL